MANRIATVSGTALVPGVSKNGRLYTRELIAKAVARAQERIAEGSAPLTMLTHHAAGDDSTRIIGSLRSIALAEDGSARFTADLADTDHARNIAALVSGKTPHLKGVSIRGAWIGNVRRERGPDGETVTTADDLELDGLDLTRTPGVPGAAIDDVQADGTPRESAGGRHLIYESAEALVTITEEVTEADAQAAGTSGPYADPGYQADKKKRYPLDSQIHAKAAWSYINQGKNAKLYTSAQLKRIKGRIKSALKKFGVTVTAESWLIDTIAESVRAESVAEDYAGMYGGDGAGSFCLNATNGPLTVSVSSYCIEPADLELILHAVVDGAVAALKAVDPDMDGDMDVPGADAEDTDDDMESAPEAEQVAETDTTPEPPAEPELAEETEDPAPEPAAVPQKEEEEPAVSEPTTPAVEPTPAATDKPAEPSAMDALSAKFDKLTDAISGLVTKMAPVPAAAESAAPAAAPAQETAAEAAPAQAPKVEETQEQLVARLVNERMEAERTKLVQEMVESGKGPVRKGLVATGPVNEHTAPVAPQGVEGTNANGWPVGWPDKPAHEFTADERMEYMGPALRQHVLQDRYRG